MQGKVLKATRFRRKSKGWKRGLFAHGKGAGQSFQMLSPSLFGVGGWSMGWGVGQQASEQENGSLRKSIMLEIHRYKANTV